MSWTMVVFTAVLALFVLVAISRIALAVERIHDAGDPRKSAGAVRDAQEELLRKRKQAP